ncbi:uncharacterized protein [Primulina huaijiensis]|uniref:uncharacterized protein isoform X3 n=1 Tax=Primulina huaijiensis TaxID=1492673 RepID=UPI003CC7383B
MKNYKSSFPLNQLVDNFHGSFSKCSFFRRKDSRLYYPRMMDKKLYNLYKGCINEFGGEDLNIQKYFTFGGPSMEQRKMADAADKVKGKYTLIRDEDDSQLGIYEKPLPCFGCGVGWFSFLVGFLCPLMWYYATILYFRNYYRRDPRERAGLAASAIAAMACTVVLIIIILVLLL